MGLLYIIISLLLNEEVHSVFEVMESPKPSCSEKASTSCSNSRSNLIFAVPTVDPTAKTVKEEITFKGDASGGKFQSYEHFILIGCAPLEILRPLAQFDLGRNANGPGLCYSLCGLQGYIGLQDGLCSCIATTIVSTLDNHLFNSSCKNPKHCGNGMLCGTQGDNKHISVYKMVIAPLSSRNISGNDSGCLLVTKDKEYKMFVVNCISSYQRLCETQKGPNKYLEEIQGKDQWVYSFNDCKETGKTPTTFMGNTTNFIFPNVSGKWWTAVVRDLVFRNCSEKSCNEQGTSTKEPAKTTMTSATAEAPMTSLISVLTVILCLIAVVAIIIVCWRRRKEKATMEALKKKPIETVVPNNAESLQTYLEHEKEILNQLEKNDQGHVSSEYDTLKENHAPFSAVTWNLYDAANFNIGDGPYEVTFPAINPRLAVQANSYDHVRLEKTYDGKYDHVEYPDQINTVNERDTYDQANALALGNTYYDTFQEKYKLRQQSEETLYDTANFQLTE